ncbi:MAG: hypothetical protein WCG27_08215, partial [Pseudomonadota bacterium]
DNDRLNLKNVEKSVEKLVENFSEEMTLRKIEKLCLPFQHWIKTFPKIYQTWPKEKQQATVLFFDPPYEQLANFDSLLKELLSRDWFMGDLWVESDQQKGKPSSYFEELLTIENIREKWENRVFAQGTNFITIYSSR